MHTTLWLHLQAQLVFGSETIGEQTDLLPVYDVIFHELVDSLVFAFSDCFLASNHFDNLSYLMMT